MTTELKKVCPQVPCYLADGIQKARNAGKRYNGRRYSHSLAYIIGAETLLGIVEGEEVLIQKLNDLQIQRALIYSQERAILEQQKLTEKWCDLMAVPSSLKRRLNALESKLDGRDAIKIFIYHPEEDTPYWTPKSPDTWQNANPDGHAVLLQVRDCGVKRRQLL